MSVINLIVFFCFIYYSNGNSHPKRDSAAEGSLVVGGQNVTDNKKYPYAVIVLPSQNPNNTYTTICSGTILSPTYVLTAGRCLISFPQNISVGVGATTTGEVTRYYTHIYDIHPQYNFTTEEFNCGVVIMETAIKFDGVTVRAVVLAKEGTGVAAGSVITLAGWGTDNETRVESRTTRLREVQIPVIRQDVCAKLYEIGSTIGITSNVFCAGDLNKGGKDACRGDWGSPALLDGVQVGILSHGVWCGHAEGPGTYTLVGSVRPWLEEVAGV